MLQLNQISCAYEEDNIFSDVSLTVKQGEIISLLGPSGCGKTTLLRCIAGFEQIKTGSIILGQQVLSSNKNHTTPEKRQIGMVFQDYALFPHLSIFDNIAFGIHHLSKEQMLERSLELLNLINLTALAQRYPHELSGGQQQRVALARALAPNPKFILLDEPFSNLDSEMRRSLTKLVRDILKSTNTSALLVTHDQDEAFIMSDKIALLADGKLHQCDTAKVLYQQPTTAFTADFLGEGSWLDVIEKQHQAHIFNQNINDKHRITQNGRYLARIEAVKLSKKGQYHGKVTNIEFKHWYNKITICIADKEVNAIDLEQSTLLVGDNIRFDIQFKPELFFPDSVFSLD